METSLSVPISILSLLGVLFAFSFLVPALSIKGWHRTFNIITGSIILIPSVFFFLAMNPWITDPRYRTFRSFFYDIKEGMTRTQVLEQMEKNYPKEGPRHRPIIMNDDDTFLGFFMNTEEHTPTCEGVFLTMRNGTVTSKGYSND